MSQALPEADPSQSRVVQNTQHEAVPCRALPDCSSTSDLWQSLAWLAWQVTFWKYSWHPQLLPWPLVLTLPSALLAQMCVVVEGSGLRTGAAKNNFFFFFFSFLLENVSSQWVLCLLPQAAGVGSRQLWTGMGLAETELAAVSSAVMKCSATEMLVGRQENLLFLCPSVYTYILSITHKTQNFLEARA